MRLASKHPLPVLFAWIALAAGPATGGEAVAILVNATGQDWRIRTTVCGAPQTPVRAGLIHLEGERDAIQEIGLKPLSELRLTHDRVPGAAARRWFEIVSVEEAPVEGYLYFRTERSWFGLGPERTRLSGAFYADGRPSRFRCTEVADGLLWVESTLD